MTSVLADSSYYIALLRELDQNHARADELAQWLRQTAPKIFTTAWVLIEVANALSSQQARSTFLLLLDNLESNAGVVIIGPDGDTFRQGIELFRKRPDKDWSLTDCISFVVMERESITEALTADHDFEQAGFKALMRKS